MDLSNPKHMLLAGAILSGAILLSTVEAMAVDITMNVTAEIQSSIVETVSPMSFGVIDLDPGGDTITLNASGGATTSVSAAGSSASSGNPTSGLITVSSPISFNINISYPGNNTVSLADDTDGSSTLPLNDIAANSTPSGVSHGGGDSNIHVGGVLTVPSTSEIDTYSGSMTITLIYN